MNQAFLCRSIEEDAIAVLRFSRKHILSVHEWVGYNDAVCFQEILNLPFPFGCKWGSYTVATAKLTGSANAEEVALALFSGHLCTLPESQIHFILFQTARQF